MTTAVCNEMRYTLHGCKCSPTMEKTVLGNIIVQHGHRAPRNQAHVRCDIAAIIGFVLPHNHPEKCIQTGDFVEIVVRGEQEFGNYEHVGCFDSVTKRAVRNFFFAMVAIRFTFSECV